MRQLGQLEAVVMERLWSHARPVVGREILEELQRDRVIAYTTVMTVLNNLYRKGFVTREMEGRAYRYRSTFTREDHVARLMEQALASSGDRGATLLHFVGQMSPEEIVRLREALDGSESDAKGQPR